MDEFDVIEQWMGATRDAIMALRKWQAYLGVWYSAGGETEPGEFDATFRELCETMGDGWADGCEAGGGLDVLAIVVKGGDVCPSCQGHGTRVDGFDPESFTFPTCETCGGVGAIPAGGLVPEPGGDPHGDFVRECVPAWERQGFERV